MRVLVVLAYDLADARRRSAELDGELLRIESAAADAGRRAEAQRAELERARTASDRWEQSEPRRREAIGDLAACWQRVVSAAAGSPSARIPVATDRPGPAHSDLLAAHDAFRGEARFQREAAARARGVRARLEGRAGVERSLVLAREQMDGATTRVQILREKVRALDFQLPALERAAEGRDRAQVAAESAATRAHRAEVAAATDRERAAGCALRLAEGRAQHAQLADIESEARHRARAADLLVQFRYSVVFCVGARLAEQAAALFGELTDGEYEDIEVDPETFQLQISDGGKFYGLDRFSGSETDLANLALRVAISEHVRFQSGGAVGLLVLDEVFGPLDDERKTRMLQALERLRGRFRQVLVVTHDSEIKEQLPNAIEVVKRPGRRATARLLGD